MKPRCDVNLTYSSLRWPTVAKDLGAHQLERLVELLTSQECEDLLSALSHPEEDIFQKLDHLSLENNQLDLQARVRRDTGTDVVTSQLLRPVQIGLNEFECLSCLSVLSLCPICPICLSYLSVLSVLSVCPVCPLCLSCLSSLSALDHVCVTMCWQPDKEAPCRTSLTEWLQKHGKQTYYDRLARALQQIGRTDIAIGQT